MSKKTPAAEVLKELAKWLEWDIDNDACIETKREDDEGRRIRVELRDGCISVEQWSCADDSDPTPELAKALSIMRAAQTERFAENEDDDES